MKTGIRSVRGDILVMMDGDGQRVPEDIPTAPHVQRRGLRWL